MANTVKLPTAETELKSTVLEVLDKLLAAADPRRLKRIGLSTTLVTNLLATGGGEPAAAVLIPGPGLNYQKLDIFPGSYPIQGAVDFRGQVTEPLNVSQVEQAARLIAAQHINKVAVVGKFSHRNNSLELQAREALLKVCPGLDIVLGFEVAGRLNFLRRLTTAYYTAVTRDSWCRFTGEIGAALEKRGIEAPLNILKADGGTMPVQASLDRPCETVFSGPAASAMGAYGLTMDSLTSVVVDIGGTTTDLALILEGKPLQASRGALIGGRYSHINSLAVRTIPLGGDSTVRWHQRQLTIGPDRRGPAACLGGAAATPTDAFNLLGAGKLGDLERSRRALEEVARQAGLTGEELARKIIGQVVDRLEEEILNMFRSWEQEPAYKVWEVVHKRKVKPHRIAGIGAAATIFVPELSKRFGCQPLVHSLSAVANALGAAIARPTLSVTLHADTQQRRYYLDQEGLQGQVSSGFQLPEAKQLALDCLTKIAGQRGFKEYAGSYEFNLEEQFNMIRGWATVGKLFDVTVQISPGVIDEFKGVGLC